MISECLENRACVTGPLIMKKRFPVQNLGELLMYIGCTFKRDWDNGMLGMNQTIFTENMVEQYKFPTTSNIRGRSVGVDLEPKQTASPGITRNFRRTALSLGVLCV